MARRLLSGTQAHPRQHQPLDRPGDRHPVQFQLNRNCDREICRRCTKITVSQQEILRTAPPGQVKQPGKVDAEQKGLGGGGRAIEAQHR